MGLIGVAFLLPSGAAAAALQRNLVSQLAFARPHEHGDATRHGGGREVTGCEIGERDAHLVEPAEGRGGGGGERRGAWFEEKRAR